MYKKTLEITTKKKMIYIYNKLLDNDKQYRKKQEKRQYQSTKKKIKYF